jgi:tetratricopeptide (TPR) repeat protein
VDWKPLESGPMRGFELPQAPASLTGPVKAWSEPVVIPTYHPQAPDPNPMFLEKRVYQGSSGRVYPLPCIDRISTEATEHLWLAVHIENEFLRVMVLPEIGGRVHVGLDKTNGYDFFYRQNVIKPALVGLAGPWISGGVEFNWPQHHRPATFMPVDFEIEQHTDGAQTIWCSDHDPMNRLKGMHGVCLHPGKSYIELKVRLYNRTPFVQTFLWWANVGVRVHELYQSFFPPDVHYVADHARRAMSRFPLCTGSYYGVNYGQRAKTGVPTEETPSNFVPPGHYPPNDLSWYANIPVPTSYMAMGSKEDFHGGYDHRANAGLVLIADHHIAPGKKQWTWGNHDFGYAWDRNLTDDGGPYIELMAGVFTDNQPDFSFLSPGETKTFSQYWYPIREIGPALKASKEAALSLTLDGGHVRVGVCVTQSLAAARVHLEAHGTKVAEWVRDLSPERPLLENVEVPRSVENAELIAVLTAANGREVLRSSPLAPAQRETPAPATEPLSPEETSSADELYLTGLHLEQYRHATRYPEAYWQEALRRDPGDARCNNALGRWHLQRGEFQEAEQHFRRAIQRLTLRNANPYDGEPYYNLGLALRYLARDHDAYDAFYKATWNQPWQSAASFALAEIDVKQGNWAVALQHLETCLKTNADHLNARNLMVIVLRKLGRHVEEHRVLTETCAIDPMDSWARHLAGGAFPDNNQMLLDLAFDYARCGLYEDAINVLEHADESAHDGALPMVRYALAYFLDLSGRAAAAKTARSDAMRAAPDYCFPVRLEELIVLESAVAANHSDSRATYYLGNLLYDRRRHEEAIGLWERSAQLDPSFSTVWRNLGIAYFNVLSSADKARAAFDKAMRANRQDARVFYERDQVWKRMGETPENRIREFEKFSDLVPLRDDLSVELATLYNQTGQHVKAKELLESRRFQPWEGGEGLVLAQHVRAHLALGKNALLAGNADAARRFFEAALSCPENLGEARHFLANPSDIFYWLGGASDATGDFQAAQQWWQRASKHKGDFQDMRVKAFSEMTHYNALALKRLGKRTEADALLNDLLHYAEGLATQTVTIDYFATSLPTLLLFEDDLQKRNAATATFLMAQAKFGLGEIAEARELLTKVLLLDRNHTQAADLLPEVEASLGASKTEVTYTHRK